VSEATGRQTRGTTMALAALIAVAFIGFLTGTRSGDYAATDERLALPSQASNLEALPTVPTYSEIGQSPRSPNREWRSSVDQIEYTLDDPFALERASAPQRQDAVIRRAARRAFEGAPPVIPHPIPQGGAIPCMACHENGMVIDGLAAPVMSHSPLANCTQCHVEADANWVRWEVLLERSTSVPNSFAGVDTLGVGERAWPGAPPTIPHRLFMRENCASCHGLVSRGGLRTSHPWRQSCNQCHVPESGEQQWMTTTFAERRESLPPWADNLEESTGR